jgi:acetamidase/formamidase
VEYQLDDSITQPFWDNSVEPRLTVSPGDVVTIECAEPIGQVTPEWTDEDFRQADPSKAHALTGSIAVNGAEPGDALVVEILDMSHKGWGWSGHMPGFGLLADEFDSHHIRHWTLESGECIFPVGGVSVPIDPFPGVVGVALAESGRLDTFPPRSNGGNIDTKDLGVGSTVWIPVQVPRALFAIGDCHAAQGDGEVCGTGVEAPMTVTARFDLAKNAEIAEVQIRRRGPRHAVDGEWHITTAHGPNLMEDAKQATRYMIDWLGTHYDLEPSDAYLICSVAGNLHISEVVDAPNWVVSMHMPLSIFDAAPPST